MFNLLKNAFSKLLQKGEKAYNTFVLSMMVTLSTVAPVYASQPRLVSGTVSLFQTMTTWLLLIIPVGAGFMLGYQALQKSMTDDQAMIAEKNRFMKNVLIGAIIAETASGLVTVILSFYS
ncbi:MAG: hypothetical protein AB7G87_01215 [Clostridia bacterium]